MPMRISNTQITATMHSAMNRNSAQMGKLMQQMASGKRITLPSDDPIASVRILRVQRTEASLNQYKVNINNVSDSLSIQEANLTAVSDSMLQVRDLLLWAANGSNTEQDLAAMAGELSSIEQTLLSFINVRDEEGRYLFSGTLGETPAATFDPLTGTYAATGNAKHRLAEVANGVLLPENTTALEIFGPDMPLLNRLHALVDTLRNSGLNSNDPAVRQQIVDTLAALDDSHGRVMVTVTELGGRQNTLSLLRDSNDEVALVNGKIEGDLAQLDYARASIDLKNYQLSLQATQKTYLKLNSLSLFELL